MMEQTEGEKWKAYADELTKQKLYRVINYGW